MLARRLWKTESEAVDVEAAPLRESLQETVLVRHGANPRIADAEVFAVKKTNTKTAEETKLNTFFFQASSRRAPKPPFTVISWLLVVGFLGGSAKWRTFVLVLHSIGREN